MTIICSFVYVGYDAHLLHTEIELYIVYNYV
jgi:hypothetical protein